MKANLSKIIPTSHTNAKNDAAGNHFTGIRRQFIEPPVEAAKSPNTDEIFAKWRIGALGRAKYRGPYMPWHMKEQPVQQAANLCMGIPVPDENVTHDATESHSTVIPGQFIDASVKAGKSSTGKFTFKDRRKKAFAIARANLSKDILMPHTNFKHNAAENHFTGIPVQFIEAPVEVAKSPSADEIFAKWRIDALGRAKYRGPYMPWHMKEQPVEPAANLCMGIPVPDKKVPHDAAESHSSVIPGQFIDAPVEVEKSPTRDIISKVLEIPKKMVNGKAGIVPTDNIGSSNQEEEDVVSNMAEVPKLSWADQIEAEFFS